MSKSETIKHMETLQEGRPDRLAVLWRRRIGCSVETVCPTLAHFEALLLEQPDLFQFPNYTYLTEFVQLGVALKWEEEVHRSYWRMAVLEEAKDFEMNGQECLRAMDRCLKKGQAERELHAPEYDPAYWQEQADKEFATAAQLRAWANE